MAVPDLQSSKSGDNSLDELLAHLTSAEVSLQSPDIRRDKTRAGDLLHASFREFGRSGTTYDRADILELLATGEPSGRIVSQDFSLHRLASNVALLTYKTAIIDDSGKAHRHTLRSSIWIRTENGWKLRFHQGTPTDAFLVPGD